MAGSIDPPFGAHALPAPLEALRRWGLGLERSAISRRVTSVVRRLCTAGRDDPFDVEPFPGQRARLYPRDNLSEKRVFAAGQFWDWAERAALADAIGRAEAPFRFVDAGANAGLYSLAVRSLAGPGRLTGVAIEPDPTTLDRLRVNFAASGVTEMAVAPVALAQSPGQVVLTEARNRGEVATTLDGPGQAVPAQTLLQVVEAAGLDGIDALKIDIEGAEAPVLVAFFRDAPRKLWPRTVLIEARRNEDTPALALLRAKGYVESVRTKLNVVLAGPPVGETDRYSGPADG